ncbi:MAG: hypothetical protein MAG551_01647 [Candidatus Scalindua arabica]|uniref:TIGR04255 family protein n=1 Tax=Candidatus Scalindua arabica TaxID=1127984 RepID=A0A941W3I9_9BACT|nr:hypothetical protein [Candidatus Scalindua arabica]
MFGFPKAERSDIEGHKRHYLKSVIFQVKFEATDEIGKNKDGIASIFKDQFPRANDLKQGQFEVSFKVDETPIIQSVNQKGAGFQLKPLDGLKVFSFTEDAISLTISGNVYKGFDNIKDNIIHLIEVFKLCKITSFNRVAIRKLNIIEFEVEDSIENQINPMQILELIINPSLIGNTTYFPQSECVIRNIHTINYSKDKNRLNLRYGLVVPDVTIKKGQILVDIDLFTVDNVSVDSLESLSFEINSEIFNIFNWAISEGARKKLRE